MNKHLQILLVEDDYMDALFINHLLHNSGLEFDSKRVENEEDFRNELENHPPDVILSDHGLPSFAGMTALAITREKRPGTPFIFVTGRLDKELAMRAFIEGAAGCISKDRISDLPPVIHQIADDAGKAAKRNFFRQLAGRMKALFRR